MSAEHEETVFFSFGDTPTSFITPVLGKKQVGFTFSNGFERDQYVETITEPCVPLSTSTPMASRRPSSTPVSNPEIRRLRIEIIRSSHRGTSHEECQEVISKLRRRVIRLNMKIDRKDMLLQDMRTNQTECDNEILSGLLTRIDKLQLEKNRLRNNLDVKNDELHRCLVHGEALEQRVEDMTREAHDAFNNYVPPTVIETMKNEYQTKIQALESQVVEMRRKHKEDQDAQDFRIQNLNAHVLKLESEKEILQNDATTVGNPHQNSRPRTPNGNNGNSTTNDNNCSARGTIRNRDHQSTQSVDRTRITRNGNRNSSSSKNYGWWYGA